MKLVLISFTLAIALATPGISGAGEPQQSGPVASAPAFVRLDGALTTAGGEARTGPVVLVVSLYAAQDDPAPLWVESQSATLDAAGRYTIFVGSTQADGLPRDFITSNLAQWIGVAVQGEPEQPRVRMVSVPYALSAANADTLAGIPAANYVMSENLAERVKEALGGKDSTAGASGGEGDPTISAMTLNFLQKSTGSGTNLTDSQLYDDGTNVGIGTTGATAKLEARMSGVAARVFGLKNNAVGGGEFAINVIGGSIATLTNGDALITNGVGNLVFSPNAAGKEVRFVAGAWTNPVSLVMNDSGFVGIGTTSPTNKLDVRGTGLISTPLAVRNSSAGGGEFSVVVSSGAIANMVAGDALITNNVGHLIFSPNVSGKDVKFVGGTWDSPVSMIVKSGGNVGIGTTAPTTKLHIAGCPAAPALCLSVDGNIAAKYQDVAEWVETSETLEDGTVVIVDPVLTDQVIRSTSQYDTRVAGAVSRQPGLILGEKGEGKSLIAQSGRVRIKVDASFGAIKPGDLLVTSPTPGHAMRSKPVKVGGGQVIHRPGTLLGKALEGLASGKGEILVLLTLQ
jgi:hypothetical protein